MRKIISVFVLVGSFFTATVAWSQAPSLAPGDKYVGLGSSFAAGPGIDNQLGGCGRSDRNYAHLVAAALELELTVASCNGATIDNILTVPQGDNPLQLDAVTADTALVTVTIGGNDIRYTASTFACSGTPASERCTANLDQAAINAAIAQLPAKLDQMYDAIRAKAPRATIVLVAYPRIFPEDAANCAELELSAEDTRYLADMGQQLEDAFVRSTAAGKALIADAYVGAAGHGPCAANASNRWVNGQSIANSGIRYHPTAEGHEEMARLVLAALGRR
ncbi:MAG: SGNH/GDSL hydrolase family protein [Gammaproteobacteria bacterium]